MESEGDVPGSGWGQVGELAIQRRPWASKSMATGFAMGKSHSEA